MDTVKEKIISILTAIFVFVGLFWLLIAGSSLIGLIILGVGLLGLIFIIVYYFDIIYNAIKNFEWKNYSLKASYIILMIGILVVINLIANKRFARFDLTSGKRYTLSDHTLKLFKDIEKTKKNVKIIFFRSPAPMLEAVDDLMKEYKERCPNIEVQFIDPDKKPQMAKEYNIRSIGMPYGGYRLYGTSVILCGGMKENFDVLKFDYKQVGGRYQPQVVLKENLEKEISSAILRVTKSKKKIYFIQAHGEANLEDEDKTGWDKTAKQIADENYIVDKVYLPTLDKVPDDCAVLIIAGPQKDYTEKEFNTIGNYLENGGHLLVLLEPFVKVNFNPLLNKWGIKSSNKFVVDPGSSYWYQPMVPLITEYNYHKITEKLKYATFFPTVAPVEVMEKKPEGVNVSILAKTSSESWIESDLEAKKVKFNSGVDKKGPISIIVAAEKKLGDNKSTRIVVIGDSDFASNYAISSYGNLDLLLNTLNWLAGKEELIGIRSKTPEVREIQLTKTKLNFILYSCVVILPLLIIVAGVLVWLRRR